MTHRSKVTKKNVREWIDSDGKEWRSVWTGTSWRTFLRKGGVFLHVGFVRLEESAKPAEIDSEIRETLNYYETFV